MCITKIELNQKVEEIRKYKAMAAELTELQKALENEVIAYMTENGLSKEITDDATISYTSQTRTTLDKKKLEESFGSLTEYEKQTSYKVLRIK
jgi:hypothetical protein